MNDNRSPQTLKEMKKNLFILIVLLGNLGFIQAQSHFSPVWGGNGVDHMNFYVMPSTINGVPLEVNDEVAVYDGGYCVGVGVFSGSYDIRVKASRNDAETGINGYTVGHEYHFKIWDDSRQIEVSDVQMNINAGSATFDIGASAYVTLAGTVECLPPPAPSVNSVEQPDCNTLGAVELGGLPPSGTWTLKRFPGEESSTGRGTNTTISDLSEGTYKWTVTDANGCTSSLSDEATIHEQPASPSAPVIGNITQPTCDIVTGSVIINGLPSSGQWTLTRSPDGVISTGTGVSTTVSGLDEGTYKWTVKNSAECISGISDGAVINNESGLPEQPGAITGNANPCPGTSGLKYSVTNVSDISYNWAVPSGWSVTSGQGTNSVTVTAGSGAGSITVTPHNSCGNGTARSLAVTMNTIPDQPDQISGDARVCHGTTNLTYSVNRVSGVSYDWTVPSGWSVTSGQGTNSITVTAGSEEGNITVMPSNSCGSGIERLLAVTTGSAPAQPGAISGDNSPCQGTSELNYSVPLVSGLSYQWTFPSGWNITSGQGTNSVTVTAGSGNGNITVTPSNSCGNGTARSFAVTPGLLPAKPGAIAGNTEVCEDNSLTYSIDPVSDATSYTWVLPSGWTGTSTSSSIAAIAGSSGEISVTAHNECGSGTTRTMDISVHNIPEQPNEISGSQSVCPGGSEDYSIADVPDANSYIWTIPSGWSGSSTIKSISLTAGNNGGVISVAAKNTCGTGIARTMNVVTSNLSAPVTGNKTDPDCSTETGSVVLSGLPGSGKWIITSLPGGQTYSGSGTSYTVTGLNAGTHTFRVSNSSGCSSDESSGVKINSAPESPETPIAENIKHPTCAVDAGSVTLTGLPASGTWTLTRQPGGSTITGSGTSKTISGLACSTTHKFSVTNDEGCTSEQACNVVINAAPQVPQSPVIGTITHQGCATPEGSVKLTGLPSAGSWTLTRNPGSVVTTGSGTEAVIKNLVPGTYTFTITNSSQCTSAASEKAIVNSGPESPETPVIKSIVQPTCNSPKGNVVLNNLPAEGTWTLYIFPGASTITGTGTTLTLPDLAAGKYSYKVTNSGGCTSDMTSEITIKQASNPPETPVIDKITPPTCLLATGSIALKNLPVSDSWVLTIYPDAIRISGNVADTIISKLKPGEYSFMVTNSSGCNSKITDKVIVTKQPSVPSAPVIGSIIQPSCSSATGSVELTGLPLGTWNLKGISGDIDTASTGTGANIIISMLPAGTYVFKVTNSEGCVSVASENAVVNKQPDIPEAPVITLENNTLHSDTANGNQWYTIDGPIDGAVNQDYIVTASGDYYAVVTNGVCTSEPSDTLHVTITDIPHNELSKSVIIYPNPVKTELTIEIENDNTVTYYEMINALGQTVDSGEILRQTVINVSSFRSGVYLIKLSNDKESLYVKIVKD